MHGRRPWRAGCSPSAGWRGRNGCRGQAAAICAASADGGAVGTSLSQRETAAQAPIDDADRIARLAQQMREANKGRMQGYTAGFQYPALANPKGVVYALSALVVLKGPLVVGRFVPAWPASCRLTGARDVVTI